MEATKKAASDCGNAMCEKYGLTIDYSIPCEEAFLQGVEYARDQTKGLNLNQDTLAEKKKQLHELQRTTFTCKQCGYILSLVLYGGDNECLLCKENPDFHTHEQNV